MPDSGPAPPSASTPPIDADAARGMASAVADLLGELLETRAALWRREAELAAGVPVVPHAAEEQHLAARLEAVLRAGAESVGAHAAALYLLDEATSSLKLRSAWGLPFDRYTRPPRALKGSMADLEALLGHAVVLDDPELIRRWQTPENFPASVCIPVSTPTTLLGTLWVFSNKQRDFSPRATNLLEVVAGRLAADLEREVLLREGVESARLKRQLDAAERLQRSQLPSIAPLIDGWQLAGWTCQAERLGGDFHDWFCLPDGLLAVVAGDAMRRGVEAALSAASLRAALRAHSLYHREAHAVLKRTNLTYWTGSAGDQFATVFFGLVETASGRVCYATAGRPAALHLSPDGWKSIDGPAPPLGEGPETDYESLACALAPGEALVVLTDGVRDATDDNGRRLTEAAVAERLLGRLDLPAARLVDLACDAYARHAAEAGRDDATVLVLKRTGYQG